MSADSSLTFCMVWNLLNFQVGILKRVLEEVEKVMQEFKAMLYKTMEDPNIDLTNVRSVIYKITSLDIGCLCRCFTCHVMGGISIDVGIWFLGSSLMSSEEILSFSHNKKIVSVLRYEEKENVSRIICMLQCSIF